MPSAAETEKDRHMAIKIEKNIVGYGIKKDDEDAQAAAPAPPKRVGMHEEIGRPEELRGSTYKIKTPMSEHALYITINDIVLDPGTEHEQQWPFEIFINSKNMEHFQWVLALTRVISAVFRKGGDITFMAAEMKQVFDPQGGYFKKGGKFMPSLVAEIGDVLETHMKKIGLIEPDELSAEQRALMDDKRAALETHNDSVAAKADPTAPTDDTSGEAPDFPPGSQLCRKCNVKAAVVLDGCLTCLSCGDSKCG